jgi:hypothetical protein
MRQTSKVVALLAAFALGLPAASQTPPGTLDAYAVREGCQADMFAATLIRGPAFPELNHDIALAVCFFEKSGRFPDGRLYRVKSQELRIIDPETLDELARQDIGCCSKKIVIALKTYPDDGTNPVKRNPRPLSGKLRALGVTRSANVIVDEDNGSSGHEMLIRDGAWQLAYYD